MKYIDVYLHVTPKAILDLQEAERIDFHISSNDVGVTIPCYPEDKLKSIEKI